MRKNMCLLLLKGEKHDQTSEQEVTWDLTELFPSINDPSVEKAINEAKVFADAFEKKYRGKIASLDPASLLQCIRETGGF